MKLIVYLLYTLLSDLRSHITHDSSSWQFALFDEGWALVLRWNCWYSPCLSFALNNDWQAVGHVRLVWIFEQSKLFLLEYNLLLNFGVKQYVSDWFSEFSTQADLIQRVWCGKRFLLLCINSASSLHLESLPNWLFSIWNAFNNDIFRGNLSTLTWTWHARAVRVYMRRSVLIRFCDKVVRCLHLHNWLHHADWWFVSRRILHQWIDLRWAKSSDLSVASP